MRTYTFKKQIKNNRGCYAEISFDVHYEEASANSLTISYQASNEWEYACKAGIYIFYDYFKRTKRGAVDIKIYDIDWAPVDTNQLVVMYTCVKALLEALDVQVEKLQFDDTGEIFVFPELRSI
jgi:hypothetical protein